MLDVVGSLVYIYTLINYRCIHVVQLCVWTPVLTGTVHIHIICLIKICWKGKDVPHCSLSDRLGGLCVCFCFKWNFTVWCVCTFADVQICVFVLRAVYKFKCASALYLYLGIWMSCLVFLVAVLFNTGVCLAYYVRQITVYHCHFNFDWIGYEYQLCIQNY